MRYYPELNRYCSDKNISIENPTMEFYDQPNGVIRYIIPQTIPQDFFPGLVQ